MMTERELSPLDLMKMKFSFAKAGLREPPEGWCWELHGWHFGARDHDYDDARDQESLESAASASAGR
jgi:hypothetical protein